MAKKDKRSSVVWAGQAGAANEVVDRYGSAAKEHFVAYSGQDNEAGKTLKRGLKKTAQSKVNPENAKQNIKQQAGYSVEDKYTARQNAEKIIAGDDTRYSRTDDLGSVNDPLFDHMQIDADGEIILGSGEQMKFVGGTPKSCLNKLASQKFEKYLDADATITIPSDYYEEVLSEADNMIDKLQQQLDRAESDGKEELAKSLQNRINKYKKIKASVKDSGITNKEAIEARLHPKLSTAKDVVKIANRAGLEQAKWGAGISGGISLIRNVVAVVKGDKKPEDAAKAVAIDTGTGAAAAYATSFAGSVIKGSMQNAESATVRSLSKTALPAAIVTSTIDVGKTVVKCIKGEIDGVECLEEIGEKGVGHMSAAMFAAAGQVVIPVPVVGAMVGSMIGYALSSASYKELTNSLKDAKIAKQRRIEIEAECAMARSMISEYRSEMQIMFESYFESHIQTFSITITEMDEAINLGDVNLFIKSNSQLQEYLGYTPLFNDFEEFDELMNSDKPITL